MKLKVEPFHAYDLVMFLFVLINQAKYYAQDSIPASTLRIHNVAVWSGPFLT